MRASADNLGSEVLVLPRTRLPAAAMRHPHSQDGPGAGSRQGPTLPHGEATSIAGQGHYRHVHEHPPKRVGGSLEPPCCREAFTRPQQQGWIQKDLDLGGERDLPCPSRAGEHRGPQPAPWDCT